MKKLTLLFLLLFCHYSYGQNSAAAIKLGSFVPEATGAGFIIGYEGGSYIDENFNFGWNLTRRRPHPILWLMNKEFLYRIVMNIVNFLM